MPGRKKDSQNDGPFPRDRIKAGWAFTDVRVKKKVNEGKLIFIENCQLYKWDKWNLNNSKLISKGDFNNDTQSLLYNSVLGKTSRMDNSVTKP